MGRSEQLARQLTRLLADFGFRVVGNIIIQVGIRGFCGDRVWGSCRGLMDAAEQLCPMIREDEFTTRLMRITAAT